MELERISKFGNVRVYKANKNKKLVLVRTVSQLRFDIASWKCKLNCQKQAEDIEEISKYDDSEVVINFNFGPITLPHSGQTIEQIGSIRMGALVGRMPEQDLVAKNWSDCQENINCLAESVGILSRTSKYFSKCQAAGIPAAIALSASGILLKDMTSYSVLFLVFLVLDDIFDNSKDFRIVPLSKATIFHGVDTFCSIISGDVKQMGPIEDQHDFPKFLAICKLLFHLRQKVLELSAPSSETWHFFTSFIQYMEGCAWEWAGWAEGSSQDNGAIKYFYFARREVTIGLAPCLELICLLKNIHLSKKIRRDPLFETLTRQICRHVVLGNDIFSLRKEIKNEETSNIILIRNMTKSGEEAYAKTLEDIETCTRNIEGIQRQLTIKFPGDLNLENYFEVGKVWRDAHVQWVFLNQRYGDNDFHVQLVMP